MTDILEPAPIGDYEQRLVIAAELNLIRELVAQHALTTDGMQLLNRRLVLPAGRINPADAALTGLRETVLTELHAALAETTGVPLDYWQTPHQPDVPDDLSGLDA